MRDREPRLHLAKGHPFFPRQAEVLNLRASGLNNLAVAEISCVSPHTVRNQITQAFKIVEMLTGERPLSATWIGYFVRHRLLVIDDQLTIETEPRLAFNSGHPFFQRQAEILEMRFNGLTNLEVAEQACISPSTVINHTAKAFDMVEAKMGERPDLDSLISYLVRKRHLIIK